MLNPTETSFKRTYPKSRNRLSFNLGPVNSTRPPTCKPHRASSRTEPTLMLPQVFQPNLNKAKEGSLLLLRRPKFKKRFSKTKSLLPFSTFKNRTKWLFRELKFKMRAFLKRWRRWASLQSLWCDTSHTQSWQMSPKRTLKTTSSLKNPNMIRDK